MAAACPNDPGERKWSQLAMVWALYFLLAFTVGQIPQFVQRTIWIGAGLVGLATVPMFGKYVRLRQIPREGTFLVCFLLWAAAGMFVATDMVLFTRHLKLVVEFVLIVISVALILERSGAAKWFYLALLVAGVVRIFSGENPISMDQIIQTEKVVDRIDAANSIGFLCALGILGMLACLGEIRRLWLRGALLAGGAVALYGVVLSASRGAFLTLIATVVLWSFLCLIGSARFKLTAVIGAVLLLILSYWVYQFIVHETYMGTRYTKALGMEDGSTQERANLFVIGLHVIGANPLFGCGLGQFNVVSGTGLYAHNDLMEVLVATGVPGFLLYYSVYWMAWRRLTWSLRYLGDPQLRYRINAARVALLILLISGSTSRPIFISQDTMFILGIVVGMAHWAERLARGARRDFSGMPVSMPAHERNVFSSNPANRREYFPVSS